MLSYENINNHNPELGTQATNLIVSGRALFALHLPVDLFHAIEALQEQVFL
jgi:hypothetical protein